VPATLDLAERARLCVNALTECTDPDYDDELYWIVDLLAREPAMYHTVDDHVQAKFFSALPLNRTQCGLGRCLPRPIPGRLIRCRPATIGARS
jgi:hypothetical protein